MGFPQSPSEFESDPRISFSKLDNKFILETDEGAEYEYDNVLKRWIPSVGLFMRSAPSFARQGLALRFLSFPRPSSNSQDTSGMGNIGSVGKLEMLPVSYLRPCFPVVLFQFVFL